MGLIIVTVISAIVLAGAVVALAVLAAYLVRSISG